MRRRRCAARCLRRQGFKVIITEEYEQADYSRTQLTLMNKAAELMTGRAPAKRGRGVKVEKITKGRILMDDGKVFVKSRSPVSRRPSAAARSRSTAARTLASSWASPPTAPRSAFARTRSLT